jgi:2-polyprenyl-3-methyl-5-hydroxy-6-metoxy-1,4-benzoquinol methylase
MPWGQIDAGKKLARYKTKMYRSVVELIKRHSPPPAMILDVGCSFGGFATEARKSGYSVCGFDIVPEAVDYVRSLRIPTECCFSIEKVSMIGSGVVDILSCLDVNYYWPNQPSELSHAFAKIKPGGYLVMRVVDKSWMFSIGLLANKIAPRIGKRIVRAAVNDHRFSMPVRSLQKVIQACGFDLIHVSPRGAIPSAESALPVQLSFGFGIFLWASLGVFMAPGALILAKKPPV